MAKRSITVAGHRTSISLEEPFWTALGEIAAEAGSSVAAIVASVDRDRDPATSLSSALRLHVLACYRDKVRQPE